MAFANCSNFFVVAIPQQLPMSPPSSFFESSTLIDQVKEELHRFANLPLLTSSYNPSLTLDTLNIYIYIAQSSSNDLGNIDAFSMNALHISCSNPNISARMHSALITTCPSFLTTKYIGNMTPLMVFHEIGRVWYAPTRGGRAHQLPFWFAMWNRMGYNWESMLVMDGEMRYELRMRDEQSGLYPYMMMVWDNTQDNYASYGLLNVHPYLLFDNKGMWL